MLYKHTHSSLTATPDYQLLGTVVRLNEILTPVARNSVKVFKSSDPSNLHCSLS